jgi:acetylornithine/succinyldiaminopimelate/putrescine aminotransferase
VLVPGTHASTFGGTPLACAAALAVFEAIEESDLLFNCRKMGEHLRGALVKLTNDHQKLKDVRGMGLMLGIVADEAVAPVLAAARSKGLLILPAGPNIIRLLPPLNVSQEDIDQAVAIVSESLEVL